MRLTAKKIITQLNLIPHPEGGYYKETYRSPLVIHSPKVNKPRNCLTDIYFLLPKGQVSRFHKIAHDEIWHFYLGSPLKIIEWNKKKFTEIIIGDYNNKVNCKYVVRGGIWQAAESLGEFSLVGCTVSPGFNIKDFSFFNANKEPLIIKKRYPQYLKYI